MHSPRIVYWSPFCSDFFNSLHVLAAIVIFGPPLKSEVNDTAPKTRPEDLIAPLGISQTTSSGRVVRVGNFFSRAYNPFNDDKELDFFDGGIDNSSSQKMSQHYRDITILAINDAITQRKLGKCIGF